MAALAIPPDEKTLSLRNRVDTFYLGRGKSPVTSFNDIEFEHPGTLKGIKGNKVDYGTIYYLAQCEDRNEPPAGPESGRMLIATSCMCSAAPARHLLLTDYRFMSPAATILRRSNEPSPTSARQS